MLVLVYRANKREHTMKRLAVILALIAAASGLSGCAATGIDHSEDRAAHDAYLESIYTKYDPEYVDDCFYYEELVCEFE
jgi:hypothetical protein